MAEYTALKPLFDDIGAAIRFKDGTTELIPAEDFPERIRAIQSGGIQLESIAITTQSNKTRYKAGDAFDPTGMTVTATFTDGSTVLVSAGGMTYDPSGPLAATDTEVTASFTFGGKTMTAQQPITVAPTTICGVKWNSSNSSTGMERLTAENDQNGLVNTDITAEPVPAVGTGNGSSPFDKLVPWSGMEEYNIVDGNVSYKQGDVGFSRSNYDTVVYIPEYWYKVVNNGSDWYFYVSSGETSGFAKHPGSGKFVGRYNTCSGYFSKTGMAPLVNITRADARTGSVGKGSKWCQYDFASWCAVEYLFRVEYASWDSQNKIGRGYVDDNSAAIDNGGTDSMAYHTGRAAGENGKTAVQYRHIENPWGNVWEWIDGININNRVPYICLDRTKFADDTATGYTNTGLTLPSSNDWIKNIGMSSNSDWAFIPIEVGGNENTFIPDALYSGADWRNLYVGGDYAFGSFAGMWAFSAVNPSWGSSAALGTRLLYNP